MSKRLMTHFVAASIVYYVIGTFWMAAHRSLPSPTQDLSHEIFTGSWNHLLLVGWLSLAAIGVIYYVVPTATNKQLYSERLGNVHFWLTNILMVLVFILENYLAFAIDPLLAAKMSIPQIMMQIMPLPIVVDILTYAAWIVQFVFVYNIARTLTLR